VREKAIAAAAAMLDVPADELDIEDGMIVQPARTCRSACARSRIRSPASEPSLCFPGNGNFRPETKPIKQHFKSDYRLAETKRQLQTPPLRGFSQAGEKCL